MTRRRLILSSLAAALLVGCAAPRRDPPVAPALFDHASYPGVFDAAREALAEYRFTLDRVDAARGVITTRPKSTAGLITPWDAEQSSLAQELQDLAHQQERTARVVFEPADAPTSVSVSVVVERLRRPGWRVETDAIGHSTHARNPAARRDREEPEFREPIAEDRALAERILARIRELADLPGAGAQE